MQRSWRGLKNKLRNKKLNGTGTMPRAVISQKGKNMSRAGEGRPLSVCAEQANNHYFFGSKLSAHGQMTSINELDLPRSVKDKLIAGKMSPSSLLHQTSSINQLCLCS